MNPEEKMQALLVETPTRHLVPSLLQLDAMAADPDRNLARAKVIGELERRYPKASAAVEAAFDADEELLRQGVDSEVDYVAVLVAAIPVSELE